MTETNSQQTGANQPLTNWISFLDYRQLLAIVKQHVLDTDFKQIPQQEMPKKHTQITVTKAEPTETGFRFWAEYTTPKDDGIVIGTIVLDEKYEIKESYGTQITSSVLTSLPPSATSSSS